MEQQRFDCLKKLIHSDFKDRHDIPQIYFTISELQWLFAKIEEQQKEIELLEQHEEVEYGDLKHASYEATPKTIFDL